MAFSENDDCYLPINRSENNEENWDHSVIHSTFPRNLIGHCYVHGAMHGAGVRIQGRKAREYAVQILIKNRITPPLSSCSRT
jgi:hypothetical protein